MNSLYLKPAVDGNIVRQPERANAQLPPHGAKVPKTIYWLRRIKDGSVVETTAEAEAKKAAEAIAKAEAAAKKAAKKKQAINDNKGVK